jgi:hypothetical protein
MEGASFVEVGAEAPLVPSLKDANRLVEIALGDGSHALLVHPTNLPPAFFDLSSGEAGEILQKLRNYSIRLALVCPPGSVRFSSRFGEAVAEERDRGWFGLFETRDAAVAWLVRDGRR